MVHINVIPLNPTVGFGEGKPSNTKRVNDFCNCLINEFQIQTTPRVRRGIDINAGCGQLKAKIQKKEVDKLEQEKKQQQLLKIKENNKNNEEPPKQLADFVVTDIPVQSQPSPLMGVYDYDDYDDNDNDEEFFRDISSSSSNSVVDTDTSTTTTSDFNSDVNNNKQKEVVDFTLDENVVDFEMDVFINPEYAENS